MEKQINYQKVNPVIRLLMLSSLIIIFVTLLISWLLWFFLYHATIESMLINFNFTDLSIIALTFSGFSLLFFLFLIFLNKETIYYNILSLLNFLLALAIVIMTLFLYPSLKFNNFLVVFLPWIIAIVASALLFVSSSINLIIIKNNFNDNSKQETLAIKQIESSDILDSSKIVNTTNVINNSNEISIKTTMQNKLGERNLKIEENFDQDLNKQTTEINNMTNTFADLTIAKEEAKNKDKQQLIVTQTKWTKKQIKQVWEKAAIIPGVNKDLYRKDYAGAWMFFSAFISNPDEAILNIRSYSWTIVNHKPVSQKDDDIDNLKPLNVINAITKGENYPKWKTKISSRGNENIIKEQIWSD